jgi:maleylpyruvate isomerase
VPGVSPDDGAPEADLRRVADASERFLRAIQPLSDAAMRQPIALDGWTRGHVLTHLARNADSHCRQAAAAVRGEVVKQYAGGFEGRAAEIEAGAERGAKVLVTEFRTSSAALAAAWRDVPADAWSMNTRDVGGRERPLRALPSRRWQELEVHLVDLEVGVTYEQWSDDFVDVFLPKLRATVTDRLPEGARLKAHAFGDPREELAWLYGRLPRADLPDLAPWG